MNPPSKDQIKSREGKWCVIRSESYNSRTTPRIEWTVAEQLSNGMYRRERDYATKRDAMHWLYVCAKV
jgi:hypothetical protein